ncbi:gag-pol polyprotein [Tanacetum coccineum]
MIKGALVLMRGEKVAANLYQLKGEIMEEAVASVASHSPSYRVAVTWHQKLGHMSKQGMKILVERKLLPGLTKVSLPFCEHCVISKQHRLKFKTSNSRGVYVLESVHSLCGKHWFYPLKARVKLDSRKKIKCLRTDNGGEYTSDEFDTFCMQEGIKRQFTTVYTPQQNGVTEQMNITLLERARAMLATASLGKSFWAEAVNTACYVINRSPSTAVELKTSMEMWTGRPMEKEFQSNNSFEAAPQHEVNEINKSQAPAPRTLNRERRRPRWHSDYVMESNVAYCLLTKEGELSTLQEALNNLDASFWKEAMQEEIEALHKNKTWRGDLDGSKSTTGYVFTLSGGTLCYALHTRLYELDGITRKHVTVHVHYLRNLSRLSQRFPFIESLALVGLLRQDDFLVFQVNLWILELFVSFKRLNALCIRDMYIDDEDLELLGRTRGKDLRVL